MVDTDLFILPTDHLVWVSGPNQKIANPKRDFHYTNDIAHRLPTDPLAQVSPQKQICPSRSSLASVLVST